jgi:hypothetical protein
MARTIPSLPAAGAGLAGGAVFLLVELVFLPLEKHASPGLVLRLLAGALAGPVTMTWPAGHIGSLLVLSLLVVLTFSILVGFFFCAMADELSLGGAIVASMLMGFALYLVVFYGLALPFAFPWLASARGVTSLVACVLYGVTTSVAHKGLRLVARVPRRAAAPVAERRT